MILRVPPTASNMPEWVRLAANAINALIRRQDAGTVQFKPMDLPSDPEKGLTVLDVADDTLKTWDGAAWRSHW